MGREIRRTPVGYTPRWRRYPYGIDWVPMFSHSLSEAQTQWDHSLEDYKKSFEGDASSLMECFEEDYGERPRHEPFADVEYTPEEWVGRTDLGYQVWQTVSEGTPVTPSFATKEELLEYLVTHGDSWMPEGGRRLAATPWDRRATEKFLEDEWAPSGIRIGNGPVMQAGDAGYPG